MPFIRSRARAFNKMNRWIHSVILLLALSVAVSSVEAGSVTHDFNTAGTITFSNNNKTGTTSLLTYQCNGSAVFEATKINSISTICLKMTNGSSEVVSDRPIPNLASMQVYYYPTTSAHTNIKVYISKDGVHWGDALSGTYSKTGIDLTFPQSDYYVRLTNTTATTVWIEGIKYTWGDCDCKAVETPEE